MPAEFSSLALSVLPWILMVTSTVLAFPQIWMSCIRGRTQGLDLTACLLAPTLSAAWLIFGLLTGDMLQITVNAMTLSCNAAILLALLMRRPDTRSAPMLIRSLPLPVLLGVAVLAMSSLAVTGLLSFAVAGSAVGMVTVAFSFVALVPQPVALLRDRTQDMSGISLGRYALTVLSNTLWTAYGLLIASPIVTASALLGVSSAVVVVYCVLTVERRAAGTTADIKVHDRLVAVAA